MSLIAEHIAVLEGDIRPDTSPRAAAAIRVISDDEAGKYLILLDVARCARQPHKVVSDQLRRAGQHLAKGIYARAADTARTR